MTCDSIQGPSATYTPLHSIKIKLSKFNEEQRKHSNNHIFVVIRFLLSSSIYHLPSLHQSQTSKLCHAMPCHVTRSLSPLILLLLQPSYSIYFVRYKIGHYHIDQHHMQTLQYLPWCDSLSPIRNHAICDARQLVAM